MGDPMLSRQLPPLQKSPDRINYIPVTSNGRRFCTYRSTWVEQEQIPGRELAGED